MAKILVVDDQDDLRTMMLKALEGEGHQTIEADNGLSALTLAKNYRPDLIISDVVMDSGSGFMLGEWLRDDPDTTEIPLILITGLAKEAGAWKSDPSVVYITKPFGIRELVSTVTRTLTPKAK